MPGAVTPPGSKERCEMPSSGKFIGPHNNRRSEAISVSSREGQEVLAEIFSTWKYPMCVAKTPPGPTDKMRKRFKNFIKPSHTSSPPPRFGGAVSPPASNLEGPMVLGLVGDDLPKSEATKQREQAEEQAEKDAEAKEKHNEESLASIASSLKEILEAYRATNYWLENIAGRIR